MYDREYVAYNLRALVGFFSSLDVCYLKEGYLVLLLLGIPGIWHAGTKCCSACCWKMSWLVLLICLIVASKR